MNRVTVNQEVSVIRMGFKKSLAAYPRRIEFQGNVYDFVDAGVRCLVRKGSSLSEIVTMSDGNAYFRMRSDNHGGNWTLLSIFS